ncbi:hypothetical protein BXZ70DRAFT_1005857 [Cristinia sonorae]|uniref:Uncharacterized protein n=1 Tax=Cristinia sonorae TaxID=1940300 RepID=A0A8K0UTB9_9AGAR|nr:hypothetical protein BXZ70DRAFT_1005857 [Cristinia sonorae]
MQFKIALLASAFIATLQAAHGSPIADAVVAREAEANPQIQVGPPRWRREAEADPQIQVGPPRWRREAEPEADPQIQVGPPRW